MKKLAALVLLVCVLGLAACGRAQQEDNNVQYFFSARVIEVNGEHLVLEVFDTGNCALSEGARVEVSTDVVSAGGCPEFAPGEYARVVMARNAGDDTAGRLEALAIYKTDETGLVTAD